MARLATERRGASTAKGGSSICITPLSGKRRARSIGEQPCDGDERGVVRTGGDGDATPARARSLARGGADHRQGNAGTRNASGVEQLAQPAPGPAGEWTSATPPSSRSSAPGGSDAGSLA